MGGAVLERSGGPGETLKTNQHNPTKPPTHHPSSPHTQNRIHIYYLPPPAWHIPHNHHHTRPKKTPHHPHKTHTPHRTTVGYGLLGVCLLGFGAGGRWSVVGWGCCVALCGLAGGAVRAGWQPRRSGVWAGAVGRGSVAAAVVGAFGSDCCGLARQVEVCVRWCRWQAGGGRSRVWERITGPGWGSNPVC